MLFVRQFKKMKQAENSEQNLNRLRRINKCLHDILNICRYIGV